MEMQARGGGINPRLPQLVIADRVYEQFKHMSEWRQEDDYITLVVYLPDFQKESIKVTTESENIVRVRRECLVAQNKWSLFQEDFTVPENCEMRGIRVRFDGGILTVTMPRRIVNAPPTAQVATKPVEHPPEEAPVKPKEEPKEKATDRTPSEEQPPLKPKEEPTERTSSMTAATESRKKPVIPLPPQKMPTSSSSPTKQEAEGNLTLPMSVGKRDKREGETGKTHLDKELEETNRNMEGAMRKLKDRLGEFKRRMMRGLGKGEMSKERELLVNMGVAVLVIVALGVHVSYTIAKGK